MTSGFWDCNSLRSGEFPLEVEGIYVRTMVDEQSHDVEISTV